MAGRISSLAASPGVAMSLLEELRSDRRGSAITEFALVAPVFLMLVLGIFDVGQMLYGKVLLNGAVQQAARSSTLEDADTEKADAMVHRIVSPILPGAEISSKRVSYYDFADVGRAERWNDGNGNGTCDEDETYTDENGNEQWDADIGLAGNGGANDTVVYTVTARYSPAFPIPFMPDAWRDAVLTATAVKKNQPFANQAEYGTAAGSCS